MSKLIDAIIAKWLCCHEWEISLKERINDGDSVYYIHHYFCKKCGKYRRIQTF